MNHDKYIMLMAESDAKFDGYDGLVSMPRVSKERYIKRAERSYYALKQAEHENILDKLKISVEGK